MAAPFGEPNPHYKMGSLLKSVPGSPAAVGISVGSDPKLGQTPAAAAESDPRAAPSSRKTLRTGVANAIAKADWATIGERPNLYPLAGLTNSNIITRKKVRTLKEGSYGRVNLETYNVSAVGKEGEVATKYFLDNSTFAENINEIAILKYLKGEPNVAQYVGLNMPKPESLTFPSILMAKARTSLSNPELYTDWSKIYNIVKQVLHGYNVMHKLGIVHCDTKPDNMLITAEPLMPAEPPSEVWITDFGAGRYISSSIAGPNDPYTGTRWYSSPEILLKALLKVKGEHYCNCDYKSWLANDCWAVGASLISIITSGQYHHFENDGNLYNAFSQIVKINGPPVDGDGEVKTLYDKFITFWKAPPTYRTRKLDANFLRNTIVNPDAGELNKVLEVINGLLTYNPENRWSIRKALIHLDENDDVVKDKPTIYQVYSPKAPEITNDKLIGVFNDQWYKYATDKFNRQYGYTYDNEVSADGTKKPIFKYAIFEETRYVVLDRLFIYVLNYLNKVSIAEVTIQNLIEAAFYVSVNLFDRLGKIIPGYINSIIPPDVTKIKTHEYFLDILKKLPLLGKTRLDEMCEKNPGKIQELGFLNLVCFQNMLYHKYERNIDKLKTKLIELAEKETTTEAAKWTAKAQMDTSINDYKRQIEAAMAQNAGTRRRRRNKKQTRRR